MPSLCSFSTQDLILTSSFRTNTSKPERQICYASMFELEIRNLTSRANPSGIQKAVGLMKEFFLSDICILYTASELATAALYIGDRFSKDQKKEPSRCELGKGQDDFAQISTHKFVNISTDVSQYHLSSQRSTNLPTSEAENKVNFESSVNISPNFKTAHQSIPINSAPIQIKLNLISRPGELQSSILNIHSGQILSAADKSSMDLESRSSDREGKKNGVTPQVEKPTPPLSTNIADVIGKFNSLEFQSTTIKPEANQECENPRFETVLGKNSENDVESDSSSSFLSDSSDQSLPKDKIAIQEEKKLILRESIYKSPDRTITETIHQTQMDSTEDKKTHTKAEKVQTMSDMRSEDDQESDSSSSFSFNSKESRLGDLENSGRVSRSISGRSCLNKVNRHKTPEHSKEKSSILLSSKSSMSLETSPKRKDLKIKDVEDERLLGKRTTSFPISQIIENQAIDAAQKKLKTPQTEKFEYESLLSTLGPNWWTIFDDQTQFSIVIDIYEKFLLTLKEKKVMKEHDDQHQSLIDNPLDVQSLQGRNS